MSKVVRTVQAETQILCARQSHSSFCSWGPLTWHCTLPNKQPDWGRRDKKDLLGSRKREGGSKRKGDLGKRSKKKKRREAGQLAEED